MSKSDIFLLMIGHDVGRQYPDNVKLYDDVSCCFIQLFHNLIRLYSVTCFERIVKGRYISVQRVSRFEGVPELYDKCL